MSRDHDHGDTPGSHSDGHGNLAMPLVRAVAQLADHRHRLAQFANESLWPVPTP